MKFFCSSYRIEPNAHLQSGDSVRMRKFWIGRDLGDGDAEKFFVPLHFC